MEVECRDAEIELTVERRRIQEEDATRRDAQISCKVVIDVMPYCLRHKQATYCGSKGLNGQRITTLLTP